MILLKVKKEVCGQLKILYNNKKILISSILNFQLFLKVGLILKAFATNNDWVVPKPTNKHV